MDYEILMNCYYTAVEKKFKCGMIILMYERIIKEINATVNDLCG